MEKIELAPGRVPYPMPCSLVGANVAGKPNYLTIAWFTMANPSPPFVLAVLNKAHYTNPGVKENGTFSINIPSVELAERVDYCGLVSGRQTDKSEVFETFYGKLKTAPMIKECACNVECRLERTVDLPVEEVFIGEIVAVYSEDRYLTGGIPDLRKINPLLLIQSQRRYAALGPDIGPAWEMGKKWTTSKP
jgi:flavin reductase (DIM6/NTAB) family NADH-FMN oxidoreductase RutF